VEGSRLTSEERAWLAGLLEGEGCFYLHAPNSARRSKQPKLVVQLRMTDKDVVERAATLMGGCKVRDDRPATETSKALYCATVYGLRAEDVMRTVKPIMGERRAAKITECLAVPNLSHYPKIDLQYRTEKPCKRCGLTKPLTDFWRRGLCRGKICGDGHEAQCRDCRRKVKP
jgi:hypothetical protein